MGLKRFPSPQSPAPSPKRLLALLPLLLLGWGVTGSSHAAKVISEGDEIRLGRDSSAEFEREVKISTNHALNAKVNRIGRRLAAVSDRPGLPFQFKVVDTPEINAVAFPGGYIYIFQGLIDIMPSDDALAAIIGHEITHATHRHWARGTERDWIATAASALLVKTPLASLGSMAGRTLLALGYSRHAEKEADSLGFRYLVEAGYDPRGAAQAWETMILHSNPNRKKFPKLLRTHPVDKDRLATLKRMGEDALKAQRSPSTATVSSLPPLPVLGNPSPTPWLPLSPGMTWTYRIAGKEGQTLRSEWRVEGRVPDEPRMVRLEILLPGDVTLRPWARVTEQGMELRMRPTDPGSPWRLDLPLPSSNAVEETVKVPAGTFQAVRVEKPLEGGKRVAVWLSKEAGVVKRQYLPGGPVEELESLDRR